MTSEEGGKGDGNSFPMGWARVEADGGLRLTPVEAKSPKGFEFTYARGVRSVRAGAAKFADNYYGAVIGFS